MLSLSCFNFPAHVSMEYTLIETRGQNLIVLWSHHATVTSCSSCVYLLSLSVTYLEILLIESLMRQSPAVLVVSVYCRRCHPDSPHRICFATVTSRSDCVCLLLLVLRFRVLSMDLFSVSHQSFWLCLSTVALFSLGSPFRRLLLDFSHQSFWLCLSTVVNLFQESHLMVLRNGNIPLITL